MLVYLCGSLNEAQVNDSGPCNGGVGDSLSECLSGELIAGWAVGGEVSNAVLVEFLTYCVPFHSTSEGYFYAALLHLLALLYCTGL